MPALFRTPVSVRVNQPYVDWANNADDEGPRLTLEIAAKGRTIYLLPEAGEDLSQADLLEDWWVEIFEEALASWLLDEDKWPQDRTREMFDAWFDVEFSDAIVDMVPDQPLTEDDVDRQELIDAVSMCAWCGDDLEPEQGRYTGFNLENRQSVEHRAGRTIPVELGADLLGLAIVTLVDSEVAEHGDVVFRVCSRKCEKLIRRPALRGLRELELEPIAD